MDEDNMDFENKEEQIVETAASDTLKPAPSRAQMTATFVELMNQLGKEDLTSFFNDSIAQIKHVADGVPGGAAKKNANTIKTFKEDVDPAIDYDDHDSAIGEALEDRIIDDRRS